MQQDMAIATLKKSSSIRLRNDSGSGKYWPTIKRATRLSQPTITVLGFPIVDGVTKLRRCIFCT